MSVSFNAKHGPILIEAEVTGPTRTLTLESSLIRAPRAACSARRSFPRWDTTFHS